MKIIDIVVIAGKTLPEAQQMDLFLAGVNKVLSDHPDAQVEWLQTVSPGSFVLTAIVFENVIYKEVPRGEDDRN